MLCTKRLGNRCDVTVGIGITSLPVNAQSFGSQDWQKPCQRAGLYFFVCRFDIVSVLLVGGIRGRSDH